MNWVDVEDVNGKCEWGIVGRIVEGGLVELGIACVVRGNRYRLRAHTHFVFLTVQ